MVAAPKQIPPEEGSKQGTNYKSFEPLGKTVGHFCMPHAIALTIFAVNWPRVDHHGNLIAPLLQKTSESKEAALMTWV